jgi:5'(3')-deoxyribonucleotidase
MVLLFDFDEVFVDLNTGALKYVNEKVGTNYTMKDVTSWDFFDKPDVRDPFFEYLALPNVYQEHVIPNKKMINVLKQMVEMHKDVYIVTASVESSQESKYKFIKEHMSFFDTDRLFTVNSSSKYKKKSDVLDELTLNYHQPIVLVDDGIHNILDMMADIKHKEKLDGMMKQFYLKRTLQAYNNPYHEFIYGIVPELPYNQGINDGKRIFKLKETKDIWKILKNIEGQHKVRVETKQAEVFNYLGNIVNELLPAADFKNCNEIQNNVSYFTKAVLNKQNSHANFLSEVARFNVAVEAIQNANGLGTLNSENAREVNKMVMDTIFKSADKKFGSDVMYQEIKNLVILHSAFDALPVNAQLGRKISENYDIHSKQDDLFSTSLIKTIIDISKDNMLAAKSIVQTINEPGGKDKVERLLHKAGMAYEIDFEDKPSLIANAILAFNKNYTLNSVTNGLVVKDQEVDEIRTSFLFKPFAVKSSKLKP